MFYNIDSVCSINGSKELGEIFISDALCAQDVFLLKKLGITHILNAAGEISPKTPLKKMGIKYMKLPLDDLPTENIFQYFDTAADFIHSCLSERGKIIVHCAMGISRSASCVIAYLVKYCGLNTADSITFLRQKRGIINPNPGFVRQLNQYNYGQTQPKLKEKFCGCSARNFQMKKF